ncbi:DUF6313 family protein [Streptomyces sp. NPDC058272]|uniref:DUF6313 family protein n=1 Tax=Streptomyces sp. NPDC058272 TaxID=3346415 RepID=UPI0036ECF46D
MATPAPDPPGPPGDSRRERFRDGVRALSLLNRAPHWLVTRASWWLTGFLALYLVGGAVLGWQAAYEVLVGLTSPGQTRHTVYAYVLCLAGWLVVPAFIGGTAGYFLNQQIDARRLLTEAELLDHMRNPAPPDPASRSGLRIRTLVDLHAEGGDARRFVEAYGNSLHGGDHELAKAHWTATVQYVADRFDVLEGLTPTEAEIAAERLARTAAFDAARLGRCFACDRGL